MVNHYFLFVLLSFASLVHAQDQSGFISIDCGIPDNTTYTDDKTGIYYVSDAQYLNSNNGVSKTISAKYQTNDLDQQLLNVRSFPQGTKNCYTLKPPRLLGSSRYFVRARFFYGNYDNKDTFPLFDIYLGVDYWDTVQFKDGTKPLNKEILYVPSNSSAYTFVCLVKTGDDTPFISALEIRLVADNIYKAGSDSLQLYSRNDLRAYDNLQTIRYSDDIYDRIWKPSFLQHDVTEISTPIDLTSEYQNIYKLPSIVMQTAVTPLNASDPIEFYWAPPDPTASFYVYMHFADFQSNLTRQFNVTLNNFNWFPNLIPTYLSATTIRSVEPQIPATRVNFTLIKTANSALPPILNAFELYTVRQFSYQRTNEDDLNAIQEIKAAYGLKRDWQGDPCLPAIYSWKSIGCINISTIDDPRIISLNLSSSELTGTISPFFVNLNMLKSLDLSNNTLTGEVPKFLSQMKQLSFLNLSGNNFTGTVPPELIERSKSGLSLSIGGNPYLCTSEPCKTPVNPAQPKKKSSMVVPIIASIAAVFVLLILLAVLWVFVFKKKRSSPKQVSSIATEGASGTNIGRDGPILEKRQQYTYSEVVKITRNFERVLGKGGFGSVFHGSIDKTQVAVKMLSPSSAQGYKQFKAEAELLMRVHHRNLTNLVGYCDEGDKLGLIYEYMSNGDLETHLSDKNYKSLSWDLRLEIALDAAQGLEYLHTGCKPPIIHRDIKTTNILLNEEMQAKLADFGLSKAFPTEGGTHVSTAFAGTPGYLDPEYNLNEKSDVFSFGVVLLEIITGKPPIAKSKERTHISRWVSQILETQGDARNVVDPRLGNDYDLNSAWKAVDVAMECVSPSSIHRPPMNHVVMELKRCLGMEKARLKNDGRSETNYESTEYSGLNIEIIGMSPIAR